MVRVAIVEDESICAKQISDYLQRYSKETGVEFSITCFEDGSSLVEHYSPVYDLIFLDIQMPGMDGITAAEKIRQVDVGVMLIFITNMAQYAIRGYAVDAQDFLVKPVPWFAFQQLLKNSLQKLARKETGFWLLPVENGRIRMEISRITYVESVRHRITVHTDEGDYQVSSTMKELEQKLEKQHFFRCNNGYLVNLARVTGVRDNYALLGEIQLIISRPKRKAFLAALTDYIGGVAK